MSNTRRTSELHIQSLTGGNQAVRLNSIKGKERLLNFEQATAISFCKTAADFLRPLITRSLPGGAFGVRNETKTTLILEICGDIRAGFGLKIKAVQLLWHFERNGKPAVWQTALPNPIRG